MDGPTDCGTQVSNWLDAHQVGIVAHNLEILIGIFSFSKSTQGGLTILEQCFIFTSNVVC